MLRRDFISKGVRNLHENSSESGRFEQFWAQACVSTQRPKCSRTVCFECEDSLPIKGRALCGPSARSTVLLVIFEKGTHCAVALGALPGRLSQPWARPSALEAVHILPPNYFACSGEGGHPARARKAPIKMRDWWVAGQPQQLDTPRARRFFFTGPSAQTVAPSLCPDLLREQPF